MRILKRVVDLTQVIENNMPNYPGDIKTNLSQIRYLNVSKYNDYRLDISMHTGTHIDSPMHLIESTEYICDIPVESFIGDGIILDVRNEPVIKFKKEYEEIVKEKSIVLLYTGFSKYYGKNKYYEDHPLVDKQLCKFLIDKNIKIIGMDMPSPDKYPFDIHKMFFENKIYIIENLTNLHSLIGLKNFEIMAFPLKIRADSSMVRVVAREK